MERYLLVLLQCYSISVLERKAYTNIDDMYIMREYVMKIVGEI